MVSTALVVITDGRGDYLKQTIASAEKMLKGAFLPALIIDDSGDIDYGKWLEERFSEFRQIHHDHRSGFGAVVRSAWAETLDYPDVEYIFHLEEDFTFNEPIDVPLMAAMLDRAEDLAQIVLKRQPWSDFEIAAGGQIEYCESEGEEFTEKHIGGWTTTHTRNFSTNPNLMTRRAAELCVETGKPCTEGLITEVCLNNDLQFAYLGRKYDPPLAHHIGEHRSQGWSI